MPIITDLFHLFTTFREDTFPEYKEQIENDVENSDEVYHLLNADLKRLQRIAQQQLNYSLLAGEYIEICDLEEQLEKLKEYLADFLNEFVFLPGSQSDSYDLVYGLRFAFNYYLSFLKDVQNRYSLNQEDYLFSITSTLKTTLADKELSDESKNFFKFFYFNVQVAKCDHFLSHDDNQFIDLFSIEKGIVDLKILNFDDLTQLVIYKISFLKIKWIYRRQKESPKDLSYLIDSKEGQVEETTLPSFFTPWKKYIKQHYEIEHNWEAKTDKTFRKKHHKGIESLTYLEIHQRIKHLKDVKKSSSELKDMADQLRKNFNPKNSDDNNCSFFNDFSKLITINYAYNNYFSLLVEQTENVYHIKKAYIELVDLQHHYINNFFIEFKFLDSILDILSKKLENMDSMEFLEEFDQFIENYCSKIFEKYKQNYRWSVSHHNYIFQLPFNECKLDIPSSEIPSLFISSSIVLPPPNKNITDDFDSINARFHALISQLQSVKNLRKDITEIQTIKNELNDQKAEIKNREIKSIEILGIFTALIAFIFGSISTFKFIHSPFQALMFIGALSVSLILFVFVLLVFNRGLKVFKNLWWFALGLFILCLLYWSTLDHFFAKEQDNLNDRFPKITDSIIESKIRSGFIRNTSDSINGKSKIGSDLAPIQDSLIVEQKSPTSKSEVRLPN